MHSGQFFCQSILPALALSVMLSSSAHGQQANVSLLRIGSTGTITGVADSNREKVGSETLRRFIKDQTGLNNEITGQQKWDDLTSKLVKGQFHLGVYQGYEFAWAQETNPQLKVLAVGVNFHDYPVAFVVVRGDNGAKDFAGLKGQSYVVPTTSQTFLRLFVDRSCAAVEQKPEAFFSKMTPSDSAEDALDDVVDGKYQVTVLDQATVEAYKQRKPGRFAQLRVLARSLPFPPVVVAYYDSVLDAATLQKFKKGLVNAANSEKGALLLSLSHLTAFESVPADLAQVLAQARQILSEGGQ